jgi:hypothetical protein
MLELARRLRRSFLALYPRLFARGALKGLANDGSWAFPAAGILCALLIHRGATTDHWVLLQIVFGVSACHVLGRSLESIVGLERRSSFPFHQIVLGQAALLVYFYARSASCTLLHFPRVTGFELLGLVAVSVLYCLHRGVTRIESGDRDRLSRVLVCAVWWISAMVFLAPASGLLGTWSGDPDYHAFISRLTDIAGHIAYRQLPYSTEPIVYPSGFEVLNAVWMRLTGLDATHAVSVQVTLQAVFAVGLALEVLATLAGGWPVVTSMVLLAIAHWAFSLPVNPAWLYFEGTGRLSHKAMAILPLTFAVRLSAAGLTKEVTLFLGAVVSSLALGWSVALNPAFSLVALPICATGLLLTLVVAGQRPTVHLGRVRTSFGMFAIFALPALFIFSDAWVSWQLRGVREAPGSAAFSVVRIDLATLGQAIWDGLQNAVSHSRAVLFPEGCAENLMCPKELGALSTVIPFSIYLAAGLALLFVWQRFAGAASLRLAALAVFLTGLASWLSRVLDGMIGSLFQNAAGHSELLLRGYTQMGLQYSTVQLLLVLIAEGLALLLLLCCAVASRARRESLRITVSDAIVGGAAVTLCGVAFLVNPAPWRALKARYDRDVGTVRTHPNGPLAHIDLDFAHLLDEVIPHGSRVLLPSVTGAITEGTHHWLFSAGEARAIPLYSKVDFAFFQGFGHSEFSAASYDRHVCHALDLPWLAANGVEFVAISDRSRSEACIWNWDTARAKYFTEVLRIRDRSLYQLDRAKLALAESDPLLGLAPNDPAPRQ